MKVLSRSASLVALIACAMTVNPFTAEGAPTSNRASASPQPQPAPRRQTRRQAYAKLLEGQRYLLSVRSGNLTQSMLRLAQQAFQEAAQLDPALAEAHTALAEIAFFFLDDLEQAEREAQTAVGIDRNNFGAHRVLSRIYVVRSGLRENNLDRQMTERAILELREVVRLDANDAEGWALLGELYQALGRDRDAIDAFTRWAATPAAVDARFFQVITQGRDLSPDAAAARLAEALLRAGRTAEAITALRRAISLEPENAAYLELLEQAIDAGGGDERGTIIELQRVVSADPTNVAALRLLARTQARNGRTDDAIALLRAAITRRASVDREQLMLRSDLALVLADALRYEEAIKTYEELLQARGIGNTPLALDEEKQFAGFVLARIMTLQRQAGRATEALATIERMRRLLGANDPTSDYHLIVLLREQGKRREALQAARQARERFPNHESFVRLEAATLGELGQVDEGIALLRARLKGSADDYEEYLEISNLYLQAGRGAEAVAAARKALELVPANRPDLTTQALVMLSSAQERAGDPKGSEESLRRVLAKEPNNATALNNLGYFLVERNERLNEALEMIQRAVRAEPSNASFLDSLGWAYFKLGNLNEAERYLVEAARRDPTSFAIQEHLGDLYSRRGRADQARAAWQRALSLNAEASEVARVKAKLSGEKQKQ